MENMSIEEISLIISFAAVFFATFNAYMLKKYMDHVSGIIGGISYKLNLFEVTMALHGMIEVPYNLEELEDLMQEAEEFKFKREDNVIYLSKEEEE
tara:strand:+ start:347 stop:634 length:288 start_codon:yes stop_codon:yes gene_type:complete